MKLIILDRDGVINYDSDNYIKSKEEWRAIPGSLAAIARLKKANFTIAVASNQSGVARGLYDETILQAIHEKMLHQVRLLGGDIDKIVYCPHLPEAGCNCRKPKPGMLLTIAHFFNADIKKVHFVGDRLTDVEAAHACGAIPVHVRSQMTEENNSPLLKNVACFDTLDDTVEALLS